MKLNTGLQCLVRAKSAFPLILLIAFLCLAKNAAGQITLVQVTPCGPASFPAACTIPATGRGHLVVIGWNGESNAVIGSITDNAGNSYTEAAGAKATYGSDGWTSDIWYAANSEAGATSVTVTVSPQGSQGVVVAWEFSGISTALPLDQIAALNNQPATATPAGAAVTTTSDDEAIISIANVAYGITGIDHGNPFTEDSLIWGNGWAHLITSTTGTYAAQWSQSPAGVYCASTASFKAPSGPTVSSVSPNSGSTVGGTAVTITGTNFDPGATVTFGGTAATNVVVVSGTEITATTPAGSAGAVTVTVTVNGQSGHLTNGFSYVPPPLSIAYVQGNDATPRSAETKVTVPFTAAQAAGDLNVVVVGWNDTTAVVSSVTDNSGNTYALAVGPAIYSSSTEPLSQSIYYAKNIAAAAAGANSVTVTFSTAAAYPDIRILEYNGADPNSPVDVTAGSSGSSLSSSSGSATTTNATDLTFGANTVYTYTSGPGSGFNQRLLTLFGDIAEDKMVTATGSYSATAPLGQTGPWVMQMVAFRTKASAGGTTYLLSAAPTSFSFGNVTVGTQSVLPIVLTNTGTCAVTITLDTVLGAGFSGSRLSLPLTLPAGQNTDLSITFAPSAAGSVTGSASVMSNASDSPTIVSLSGAGVNSHYVALSWTASTSSGVIGYNIYRGTVSGGPYTQLNSSLVAGTTYTDSTVQAGQTYYYVATAVNSSEAQSGYSKQASATDPTP